MIWGFCFSMQHLVSNCYYQSYCKTEKNNIKCRHDYNVLDMIYEGEKAETDREKVVQQLAQHLENDLIQISPPSFCARWCAAAKSAAEGAESNSELVMHSMMILTPSSFTYLRPRLETSITFDHIFQLAAALPSSQNPDWSLSVHVNNQNR